MEATPWARPCTRLVTNVSVATASASADLINITNAPAEVAALILQTGRNGSCQQQT